MHNQSKLYSILLTIIVCLVVACNQVVAQQSDSPEKNSQPTDGATASFANSLKIVKLLWKSNPKSASSSLAKLIDTAMDRKKTKDLSPALEPLRDLFTPVISNPNDDRFSVSVAAMVLIEPQSPTALDRLTSALDTTKVAAEKIDFELLAKTYFVVAPAPAFATLQDMLNKPPTVAWSQMIQQALAADRLQSTKLILAAWNNLPNETKISAIEPMTAQPASMQLLVNAVKSGSVSKELLNMNQLRKWLNTDHADLTASIESVWGRIATTDNAERQKLVSDKLKLLKSGVKGSVTRGQATFARVCSQCHQLHGQGVEVGPAITNNGRGNLEQLVSNVFDPSLVIGAAFQAKTVLTADGEVIAGLVVAEDDQHLKLKVQGGKVREFDKQADIEQVKNSSQSLMPEGLESQLSDQELCDLFAYLCLVKAPDVPDNELIPGTPDGLVNP